MLLRTSIVALALTIAAPMAAQAQSIDLGRGGPQIDLRSNKQRLKDDVRDQQAQQQYRGRSGRYDRDDSYGSRGRDRDMSTGSVRRYEDRGDSDRGRGRW